MKKKLFIIVLAAIGFVGVAIQNYVETNAQATPTESVQQTPPDVIVLAENSKLGKVTFNHLNHTTKNFNLEGNGPIACIECHHAEQPVSDTVKFAYPADRKVTLTAETAKDAATPKVTTCGSCHAAKDTKPSAIAEIPQFKNEKGEMVSLNNQNAFHRNCATCHDQVMKLRPTAAAPTTMKCMVCHKKS